MSLTEPWNFAAHLRRPEAMGTRHAIASGHQLATQAGMSVLESGGNAIDAGVAAGLVLNVTESQQCSFSGVAPIMIHRADRAETTVLDGLGRWPAAASSHRLRARGWSHIRGGIEATVVPGAPSSWLTALERYGTWSFGDVADSAIRYADQGFVMYPCMAQTLSAREDEFPAGGEAHRILFPGGKAVRSGDVFRQPDLANSLRLLVRAEQTARGDRAAGIQAARDCFYRGEIAAAFVDYHQAHGGLLTMSDMAEYRTSVEAPCRGAFRGNTVLTCGPWCQGPMLLQELAILERFDLESYEHNSPEYLHLVIEAIKLAAFDRERYYGDPDYLDVPLDRLLSREHAAELARRIRQDAALTYDEAADDGSMEPAGNHDTTYVSVVDRWGNAFSATPSDGIMHRSPVVPGLGMAASPRGVQSHLEAGHPAEVAPGRRPRLTPNPAMLLSANGVMPFGSPGGDLQTQAMLQFLLNVTIFGMTPQRAVEAGRVYSYDFPDSFAPHNRYPRMIRLEYPVPEPTARALAERGHEVTYWPRHEWPLTSVCAVSAGGSPRTLTAAADHRRAASAQAQ